MSKRPGPSGPSGPPPPVVWGNGLRHPGHSNLQWKSIENIPSRGARRLGGAAEGGARGPFPQKAKGIRGGKGLLGPPGRGRDAGYTRPGPGPQAPGDPIPKKGDISKKMLTCAGAKMQIGFRAPRQGAPGLGARGPHFGLTCQPPDFPVVQPLR